MPSADPVETPTLGLLADSQIKTLRTVAPSGSFNGLGPDARGYPWVRRPPALDRASPDLLAASLENLRAQGASVIVFLGDGAHHGCADELSALFGDQGVLPAFVERTGIPIFYTLGNHDYLGAGNASRPSIRRDLCASPNGENPPASKLEVAERIQALNARSVEVGNGRDTTRPWHVVSSIESMRASCRNERPWQRRRQQFTDGCALTTIVTHAPAEGPSQTLVLADSSDYHRVRHSRWVRVGFPGDAGAISARQALFIDDRLREQERSGLRAPADPLRVFTHYPVVDMLRASARSRVEKGHRMSRVARRSAERIRHELRMSFLTDPLRCGGGQCRWFSAHRHASAHYPPVVHTLGPVVVLETNIGSVTDSHPAHASNPHPLVAPHAALVDPDGSTHVVPVEARVSCPEVLTLAAGIEAGGGYAAIDDAHGLELLGVTTAYQRGWGDERVQRAVANLERFATEAATALGMTASDARVCLGLEASRREAQTYPPDVKGRWPAPMFPMARVEPATGG